MSPASHPHPGERTDPRRDGADGRGKAALLAAALGVAVGGGVAGVAVSARAARQAAAARAAEVAALTSAQAALAAAREEAARARRAVGEVLAAGEAVDAAGEAADPREALGQAVAALEAARDLAGGGGPLDARLARALVDLGEADLASGATTADERFVRALALAPAPALRARALVGRATAGAASPDDALAAARQAASDEVLARALLLAAADAGRRGEADQARERAAEGLGRARAAGPTPLLAAALEAAAAAPGLEAAALVPLLEEAARARHSLAARGAPDDLATAGPLARALLALAAADARRAPGLVDEAATLARQVVRRRPGGLGERDLLLAALEAEARVRADAGDRPGARTSLEQALPLARALAAEDPGPARARAVVRVLVALGPALARERDLPRARRALEEAADAARGDPACAADRVLALLHLASLDQEQGRAQDARARLEEASALAGASDDLPLRRARGLALWRLAGLDQAQGDVDAAVAHLEEAVAATRAPGAEVDGLTQALAQARARRDLLRGPPPAGAAEALQQAYALLSLGDPAAALARFEAALGDAATRADVSRGHLYHAARAAAQAGQRARALEWLAEDVRRRRERLAALSAALDAPALDDEERGAAARERERLLRQLDHARRAEPAFAGLRGEAEFEALFR